MNLVICITLSVPNIYLFRNRIKKTYRMEKESIKESKKKITTKLPVASAIIANNHFWLHGRKPFKENKDLSRELLRIRGSFFI